MSNILKEVLFNDGEALDFNDLNGLQRYSEARLNDCTVMQMIRNESKYVEPSTSRLYAFPGCGVARLAGTFTVSNIQGTVFQKTTSGTSGTDPTLLSYFLSADELSTIINTPDPTNPRWDLIQVKLAQVDNDVVDNESRDFKDATTGLITTETFVKKRKVSLTFNTKQGTPAGSPVKPTPDPGFVPWCYVFVRAAAASLNVFLNNDIHDAIFPIGYRLCPVFGSDGFFSPSGDWIVVRQRATNGSSSSFAVLSPRAADPRTAKCVAVSLTARISAPVTIKLVRFGFDGSAPTVLKDLTSNFSSLISASVVSYARVDLAALDALFWGSGYSCSTAIDADISSHLGLQLENAAGGNEILIASANFEFMGG